MHYEYFDFFTNGKTVKISNEKKKIENLLDGDKIENLLLHVSLGFDEDLINVYSNNIEITFPQCDFMRLIWNGFYIKIIFIFPTKKIREKIVEGYRIMDSKDDANFI